MKMQKRGLSDVVTTVIIILLVIAAIAIIWSFVQPTLRGAGENIQTQTDCFTLSLEPVSCQANGADWDIGVKRNSGEAAMTELRLVVEYADGSTQVVPQTTDLPEQLETKVYTVSTLTGTPASITVAGVVGQGTVCDASPIEVTCA